MIDDLKTQLISVKSKIDDLKSYLNVEKSKKRMDEIQDKMAGEGFWQNKEEANKIIVELKQLKAELGHYFEAEKKYNEIGGLISIVETDDKEGVSHLKEELDSLSKKVDELEFRRLLGKKEDKNNAIISINAGAGGTESCDWAQMLLRMYSKWSDKKGFEFQTIDILPGEEAGVKNVTAIIRGPYAYGYLKAEEGVHRLVRISPFDANRRRHTSFASVDVTPEIEDDIQVEISPSDLRIDTFRAGGHGGQHVNTTDSAVRITHIPTGIAAQCQNERSQHQNKFTAMKILKARIYEKMLEEKRKELEEEYEKKTEIGWGRQIRSYVLHPYNMVKDLRTNIETSDTQGVMDGDIDKFIEAYLKQRAKMK